VLSRIQTFLKGCATTLCTDLPSATSAFWHFYNQCLFKSFCQVLWLECESKVSFAFICILRGQMIHCQPPRIMMTQCFCIASCNVRVAQLVGPQQQSRSKEKWNKPQSDLSLLHIVCRVGQNRIYTPYMTVGHIWWFPCKIYRICTVYIWLWPTLTVWHVRSRLYAGCMQAALVLSRFNGGCTQKITTWCKAWQIPACTVCDVAGCAHLLTFLRCLQQLILKFRSAVDSIFDFCRLRTICRASTTLDADHCLLQFPLYLWCVCSWYVWCV